MDALLPPEGVLFRIISVNTEKALWAESNLLSSSSIKKNLGVNDEKVQYSAEKKGLFQTAFDDFLFGSTPLCSTFPIHFKDLETLDPDGYEDGTWFTLEKTDVGNFYLIRHINRFDRWLFANADEKVIGLTDEEDRGKHYEDQLWLFHMTEDGTFQLFNYKNDRKLFMRKEHPERLIGLTDDQCVVKEQLFRFSLEEFQVDGIKFDFQKTETFKKNPNMLLREKFENLSTVEQRHKLTVKYTKMTKQSWIHMKGFKLTAGTKVNFTLPGFSHVEVGFSVSTDIERNLIKEIAETSTKEVTEEFPLIVPPGTVVEAEAVLEEEEKNIPYTMTLAFRHSKVKGESEGIWKGVKCVNMIRRVSEKPVAADPTKI